jgi:Asp-tRNA(Asn)/Glu-tRNA(Gln) amidotransferase A subunit family amidase
VACLERIAAREPAISAWVALDPERVLREASLRDKSPPLGPLHGIPFAVKDVFDTADYPTGMGSPIYQGYQPRADAACVALLQAAGAVVLGKTLTCEFAGFAPGPTRNPHNLAHTPGGSSSGSAAAVADFMVPAGLGSQTGGSVIRPAAYCGIIGFKPSYGLVSRAGLKLAAEELDTIGLLARSVEDIALLSNVLASRPPTPAEPLAPKRIGLCRTFLWDKARSETREALEITAERLSKYARVEDVTLPAHFSSLTEVRDMIDDFERARALAYEWQHHRDLLSPAMIATIERGLATPYARYIDAKHQASKCRGALAGLFAEHDCYMTPATIGEAEEGLGSTGSSTFQGLWTLLHGPAISLPLGRGPKGLPVGIQLVAPIYEDERLLRIARWVEDRLTS